MNKLIIQAHYNIEYSPKDIDLNGHSYDITKDFDTENISQWAAAITLARYKIGQEVEEQELMEEFHKSKVQQLLDNMVDKGIFDMTVTETGEPGYIINEKGIKDI